MTIFKNDKNLLQSFRKNPNIQSEQALRVKANISLVVSWITKSPLYWPSNWI